MTPGHATFWHVHLDSIVVWGFVATVVVTTIMSAGQGLGVSRMGFPFLLGTIFTGNRNRAQAAGFACQFALGWVLSLLYAFVFETWHRAGTAPGLLLGPGHGLFVLTAIMPLLPHLHSRMASEHDAPTPTRMLESPGFLAMNYGRRTPLVVLLAHLLFGAILGSTYQVVGGDDRVLAPPWVLLSQGAEGTPRRWDCTREVRPEQRLAFPRERPAPIPQPTLTCPEPSDTSAWPLLQSADSV